MSDFYLRIGGKTIDLLSPQPDQINLWEIEKRLRTIHRWSNDPDALTVHQHRHLTLGIARFMYPDWTEVHHWAYRHDDHEGILGDFAGPLEKLLASGGSDILSAVKHNMDVAIMAHRGEAMPDEIVREFVHDVDMIARTMEWIYVMGHPMEPWLTDLPFDSMPAHKIVVEAVREADCYMNTAVPEATIVQA